MRLLLDTHTFIWAYSEPDRLPETSREAIADSVNEVFVSAVSFWEIAINVRIGKLKPIGRHPAEIAEVAKSLGITAIPLLPEEAATSGDLIEDTHFDPFDRMLVWQAINRKLVLVSGDKEFERFKPDGLTLLWR